ncbi:MAG: 3-dehydroquinate synthase [Verrucomicrobia bacterium]|nr:3-dehydroquinate synthase [Verrucomicrobiota bacterium]
MGNGSPPVVVELGNRSYCVHIGDGLLAQTGQIARENALSGRAAIVSDSRVAPLYLSAVQDSLAQAGYVFSAHVVPSGEQSKSLEMVKTLCEQFAHDGVDRHSFVVALGGGVIGDLAGFVAAIYYRGIPVIQLPTTLMAQVDSSVGGKTGVNLNAGKNLVGAFHQPHAVIADTLTLTSLSRRDFNEGVAEVIKYGAISDPKLLGELSQGITSIAQLVRQCVRIKAGFVTEDERETSGRRALLNFGHTIGHAIEAAAGYGTLLHGEAIALGMLAAAEISSKRVGFPAEEAARLRTMIQQYELPTRLPSGLDPQVVLRRVFVDKKFQDGNISFVVCSRLGNAFSTKEVTREDLAAAIVGLQTGKT